MKTEMRISEWCKVHKLTCDRKTAVRWIEGGYYPGWKVERRGPKLLFAVLDVQNEAARVIDAA